MAVLIPEPLPDFAFLYAFGSVYFGIVSRRRRPPKSKNPPKKWQHLTGITGSLSSESVAWFAPDYPEANSTIAGLSIRIKRYVGEVKNGKAGQFEFDRKITNKVNEFLEAMAILERLPTKYRNRERIRSAFEAIRTGAYKNWNINREIF